MMWHCIATSRDSFESVAAEFVKVASEWGLTVSTEKTKGMVVGEGLNESDVRPVQVGGGWLCGCSPGIHILGC